MSKKSNSRSYYVYVLLCDNGSYYTGYARNANLRVVQHLHGRGARYTRMHRPKRLIYLELVKTRSAAMRRERQIKSLSHVQKRDLELNSKTNPRQVRQP
jgi:putative endonuclease